MKRAIVCVMLVAGCKHGPRIESSPIGRDSFAISVRASSTPGAFAAFFRRAGELCDAAGYDSFKTVGMETDVEHSRGLVQNKPFAQGIVQCTNEPTTAPVLPP